jgi:hypothetical protein
MAHQFVREPLRAEEADRLANACQSAEEKPIVWTFLDTGLRVSELCSLTLDNLQRRYIVDYMRMLGMHRGAWRSSVSGTTHCVRTGRWCPRKEVTHGCRRRCTPAVERFRFRVGSSGPAPQRRGWPN